MKHSVRIVCAVLFGALIFQGCASSKSGKVYTRDQTRQAQRVEKGTVTEVRTVKIEGTKSAVGTFGGAAIGGIGGSILLTTIATLLPMRIGTRAFRKLEV